MKYLMKLTLKEALMDNLSNENEQHNKTTVLDGGIEITEDISFTFDGYQVVRGEFFAHTFEPTLTFSDNKVYVNTACVKKLPQIEYVQLLVNPDEKKLAVRPCTEDAKDSFRWCSATSKRTPKQITCRVFYGKLLSLMDWNPKYRYKLLGKLIKSNNELLFVFDLNSPEIFVRKVTDDNREITSRTASYPEEWKNQFGLPVEEHQNSLQINIFDGYTVFGVKEQVRRKKLQAESLAAPANNEVQVNESEVNTYEQTTLFTATDNINQF